MNWLFGLYRGYLVTRGRLPAGDVDAVAAVASGYAEMEGEPPLKPGQMQAAQQALIDYYAGKIARQVKKK